MRKNAFLTMLGLLFALLAQAQSQVTVSGVVTKLADGSPVADHLVYCFAGDSIDPNGNPGSIYGEALTDVNGSYSIALDVPAGINTILVSTFTACLNEFFPLVNAPINNGEAHADFQVCDDSLPPFPDCWVDISVLPVGGLTFEFNSWYYGIDSLQQAETYQWIFGDGTSSTEANPTHTFAQPGLYIVTLTVTGTDGCVATAQFPFDTEFNNFPECMGYILYTQTGTTSFDFSSEMYDANGNPVQVASYSWDFGDGETSTEAAPSHTYAEEGIYTVQLHAVTEDSCEIHSCDVVFALDCPVDTFWYGCQAMFATGIAWPDSSGWDPNNPGGGNLDPLTVSFIDLSLGGVVSWAWDFGDDSTSTEQNPTHTYAAPGLYTVSLSIVTVDGCESEISFEICVGDDCWLPEPDCQAMFIPLPDSIGGNGIQFLDLSIAQSPIQTWTWTFGDGTASNEQNPYHVYSQPGVYPVSLTITADSCNSTISFEVDTEHPWNFNNPGNPSKLGVSGAALKTTETVAAFESARIFPNPVQNEVSLAFNSRISSDYTLRITDLSGKTLINSRQKANIGLNSARVDVSSLVPGLYLAEIRSGDTIQTMKLVKQ